MVKVKTKPKEMHKTSMVIEKDLWREIMTYCLNQHPPMEMREFLVKASRRLLAEAARKGR
jgi:hypothetical protein